MPTAVDSAEGACGIRAGRADVPQTLARRDCVEASAVFHRAGIGG